MDDLLDLDWSKNADQSKAGNSSVEGASRSTNLYNKTGGGATSSYNFDALTRSMPTSQVGTKPQSRTLTPTVPSSSVKSNNTGVDAFSSLLGFSGTPPSSSTNNTSMSMAERLKQNNSLEFRQANPVSKPESSAWDGLDDFMSASSLPRVTASTSKTQRQAQASDDLWDFGTEQAKLGSAADIRPAKPKQKVSSIEARPKDAFDFSEFEDPGASQSSALVGDTVRAKTIAKPSRNVLDDNSFEDDVDDDSVLGSLARPARPLASAVEDKTWQRETRQPAKSQPRSRAASPPPHIVGQVVEMGFSPAQAREALLATNDGQNVAAAIEMLLQNAKTEKQQRRQNGLEEDEERDRRYALRVQQEEDARRRQRRPGSEQVSDPSSTSNGTETPTDWQKQADQLYAQASEIGANVFSRANALWTSAKTQAQKALDEHNIGPSSSNASSGRSSPASGSDRARNRRWAVPSRDGVPRRDWQGKPKWMLDAEQEDESPTAAASEAVKSEIKSSQFKDDDDIDIVREAPAFVPKHKATSTFARRQSPVPQPQADSLRPKRAEQVAKQASSPVIEPSQVKAHIPRAGPVVVAAPKARILTQDDQNAIQTSARHRQRGNESFKRGAYGEAEAAYSLALDALQTNLRSVRRIAVLNNRANVRIKNGDAKGALDDTLAVLRIIVVQENERSSPFLLYRPSQEAPLPLPEYAEINLRDGYAKALLRRAQAEEQLERWDPALSVWSLLEKYEREEGSGTNGVSNLRAAQDGKGRCNKMLKGGAVDVEEKVTQRPAVVNPRVRAAAARAVAKAEAQAKERIRTENAAAAAEEAKKDTLRDSVDARILSWKTGKENNVRALLASLHDVVWPGLAWKRIGMHELVMDNQVKKCYMRAIGKLHPDKLTPRNNTVEERMIGGAVFSVLNEAYASSNV